MNHLSTIPEAHAALYLMFWPVWYGAFVCWALGQGLVSASVHKEHERTLVKLKFRQRLRVQEREQAC